MTEWLAIAQLSELLNKSHDTVLKNVKRGRYSIIKRSDTSTRCRGGKIWLVSIHDPAILESIREKYLSSFAPDQLSCNDKHLSATQKARAFHNSPDKLRATAQNMRQIASFLEKLATVFEGLDK